MWSRSELERYQLDRLNRLLAEVLPENEYYRKKFGTDTLQLSSLDEWSTFPTSCKSDWIGDSETGIALHHTYPRDRYQRFHRTSGTRGKPMVILDTAEDWRWWVETWQYVLDGSGIESSNRILMAFSFGPFIGFWSAHDACLHRGCMVIPSGGLSTAARIDLILSSQPSVLFSTPSYALHLGEEAQRRGIDLATSSLRKVFVAGEPGGSMPGVRSKIERLMGAEVMDHAGATEVGPWGFGTADGNALHVIETEFIAEYIEPENPSRFEQKDVHELVLTSLGRKGAPVLRYRTGDLVRPVFDSNDKCRFVRLESGVIGRADDMLVIRGVNVFPTSIDAIVRSFESVTEYRMTLKSNGSLDELELQVEDANHEPVKIAEKLLIQLNLRVNVIDVPPGSLPRSEGKSRRIIDERKAKLNA